MVMKNRPCQACMLKNDDPVQENGPNIQGLKGLNKFGAALANQRRAHFP